MSFNKNHPECRAGEVFLTNTDDKDWDDIGWKSKRRGQVAYDRSGLPVLTSGSFFPVFVQRDELEEAGIDPATW
jgi:hypothetical protein